MIYEITAIIIGPVVAFLTVWLEYYKDNKEKLQDRKDQWLNEHYKQLSIEFQALSRFSPIITIDQEGRYLPSLEGFQLLGTSLVEYEFESNYIKVWIKLELNYAKEIYKNSIAHLQKGYQDVYAKMEKLWESENIYKDSLYIALNDILKRAQELMKINFPNLNPLLKNGQPNSYYIKGIVTTLIGGMIENDEKLEFEQILQQIYSKVESDYIIANVDDSFYNKFENNVWKVLNDKFKTQINDLKKKYENLSKDEKEFTNSINNIIDCCNSGHSIKGSCDVCNKIYNEKDIKKLRPKV